jgi:hypothetical protein
VLRLKVVHRIGTEVTIDSSVLSSIFRSQGTSGQNFFEETKICEEIGLGRDEVYRKKINFGKYLYSHLPLL